MAIANTVYWVGNKETIPVENLASYFGLLLLVQVDGSFGRLAALINSPE